MHSRMTDPDLLPLWQAIADRLAQGEEPDRISQVKVRLSRAGHAVLAGWLASDTQAVRRTTRLRYTDGQVTVPLPKLLRVLQIDPAQLPAVVIKAVGAYKDLAAERRRAAELRDDLWAHAAHVLPDSPRLLARLRAAGVSDHKAEDNWELINSLGRARANLPLPRPVPLPRFALTCAGKPHYFDLNDSGHGDKLVLLAIDLLNADLPDTPAAARAVLARVGVLADRLSQTVLTLNIDASGNGPVDRAVRLAHADRRPIHLTLYDLVVQPPSFTSGEPWLVVENPSVMDEALIRGVDIPIVCTSGTLSAVDHVLLDLTRQARIPIQYCGDIDQAGISIAENVHERYGGILRHMDELTVKDAHDAGPLTTIPPSAPVLSGPSEIAFTANTSPNWPTASEVNNLSAKVVFQEHPLILDRLLGADKNDPLQLPGLSSADRAMKQGMNSG